MLQSFLQRLLERRHFWRYASFDKVAELYASRMMRLLAQNMINLFVALYLYEHGYSILFIAVYYLISFIGRMLISYPTARFVARFGPKHGILAGNLLYIPALVCFTLVGDFGLQAIIGFGIFQALSNVVYDLSYLVSFSKVKHVEHAGKEIGYMQIIERAAASLSPLLGGLIAFMIAPEVTMWLSAALFALASWPLMRTDEPVKTRQKLEFRGFPWRMASRSIVAESAVGWHTFATVTVWILFQAVVVFAGSSDDIYFKVGALASITVVTSFMAAYTFGRLIDRRRGGDLLHISTIATALTHVFRAFITTPVSVAGVNITSEIATTGFSMSFQRGIFDTADLSGRRIVYMFFIEIALNAGAALACAVFALLIICLPSPASAMQLFFGCTAVYSLLMMTANFSMYRKKR